MWRSSAFWRARRVIKMALPEILLTELLTGSTVGVEDYCCTWAHKFRHITFTRTSLDEWSARRGGLYLHSNKHETNIHALSGILTRDPNNRAPQIYALDRSPESTEIKLWTLKNHNNWLNCQIFSSIINNLLGAERYLLLLLLGKVSPYYRPRMLWGESRGIALLSLWTSALRRGGWSVSRPGRLYPRERPGAHCTGGWVGLGAGLDRYGKSRPPTGIRSPDLPARSESLYRLSSLLLLLKIFILPPAQLVHHQLRLYLQRLFTIRNPRTRHVDDTWFSCTCVLGCNAA